MHKNRLSLAITAGEMYYSLKKVRLHRTVKSVVEVGSTVTKTTYTAQIQHIRIRQRLRSTLTGVTAEPSLRYDDAGVVKKKFQMLPKDLVFYSLKNQQICY